MLRCSRRVLSNVLWTPKASTAASSQMARYMAHVEPLSGGARTYKDLHQWSVQKPEEFWMSVSNFCGLKLIDPPTQAILNPTDMEKSKWFPGAKLNFAENLLRFEGQKVAIKNRPENGDNKDIHFSDLKKEVARLAHSFREAGVKMGDRVAGCVTNGPHAIIGMLAATSLGAIWSSCSPDFGPQGIADRFGQVRPKVIITVDGYQYNGKPIDVVDKMVSIVDQVGDALTHVIVIPNLKSNPDISKLSHATLWGDFIEKEDKPLHFVPTPFDHPVYIMFSSGTTGLPKCITHGAGGTLLQHLKELTLHVDLRDHHTMFYHTTCGWMMWNWMLSSLTMGASILLYDGSPFYPKPHNFFDIMEADKVSHFGTSAKFLAAVEKERLCPAETHDLTDLQCIMSTGSVLAESQFEWVYRSIKKDVQLASITGGTDIISLFAGPHPMMPVRKGELQCMTLGMDVDIFDEKGKSLRSEKGELVCKTPFAAQPVCFWNDEKGEKYHKAYFAKFPNIWAHGDYAEITPTGGVIMHGRSDAVLNPKGVRIGTAEIYRVVDQFEEILESIAVGQAWEGDERIVLFVRMNGDHKLDADLEARLRATIRQLASVNHVPAKILPVNDIPRTGSGKITEIAVRDLINGKEINNKEAIINAESLKEYIDIPALKF